MFLLPTRQRYPRGGRTVNLGWGPKGRMGLLLPSRPITDPLHSPVPIDHRNREREKQERNVAIRLAPVRMHRPVPRATAASMADRNSFNFEPDPISVVEIVLLSSREIYSISANFFSLLIDTCSPARLISPISKGLGTRSHAKRGAMIQHSIARVLDHRV